MYIQVTTRCNMNCTHCCYSCTEEGTDMNIDTLHKALESGDEYVTIGGGEPTLHPRFKEMLFDAISKAEWVWLATNGSQTDISLTLAKLAKKGIIGCALSLDDYHNKIDNRVIEAFKGPRGAAPRPEKDCREIRNVTGREIISGRNTDLGKEGCVCSDLFVSPSGDIYGCGCKDSPRFGNVNTEYIIPDNYQIGECYKDQEKNE